MKAKSFTKPNGRLITSSQGHNVFVPNLLPPQIYYDNELINLLATAERKIGELKGIGSFIDNPNIMMQGHLKKEAVMSSRIEGTLASIQDVLQHEAIGKTTEHEFEHLRMYEVLNYIRALQNNLKIIHDENKPITLETIKNAHGQLMQDVRGYNKKPGEFRTIQNWIVGYGQTKKTSTYTPPPPEYLEELLKNLEEFINHPPENMPVLIQCAIMHYQFEAIHPFEDGNGRIGRMLISLLLAEKNILPRPLLYLSEYFEKNRTYYYTGLLAISQKSKWREWIKFFLRAIIEQAENTIQNINALIQLQKTYKERLKQNHANVNAYVLVEKLIESPYMTVPKAQKILSVSYPTAKNVIKMLISIDALEETAIRSKSRVFVSKKIVDVFS